MSKVKEINIAPCGQTGQTFYIINAEGVVYKSDSFENLIRSFASHTQQPIIDFGLNGISILQTKKNNENE